MGILWILIGIVVLAMVVPLIRAEVTVRRRASLELPPGLSGAARRQARRNQVAILRHSSRLMPPNSNTAEAGGPGVAFDSSGHN